MGLQGRTPPGALGRRRGRLLLASLVCAGVAAVATAGAGAQSSGDCSTTDPCVILIQVDGLEAKDVTPQSTPFMWSLAHPHLQECTSTEYPGAAGQCIPAQGLGDRDGFMWQAPRAAMTAGLAANTASLLTGGYPEQHGVPSDDFYRVEAQDPDDNGPKPPTFPGGDNTHYRLESDPDDRAGDIEELSSNAFSEGTQTLLDLVEEDDGEPAAFVGDPDLAELVMNPVDLDLQWTPPVRDSKNGSKDPQHSGNTTYCDVSRSPGQDALPFIDVDFAGQTGHMRDCAANDMATLDAAIIALQGTAGNDVNFTYIELAEVGHVKRLTTDDDRVSAAIAQTDFALTMFFYRYAASNNQQTAAKWGNTTVFLVGSGGYEPTPQRVPNPANASDPGTDLAGYVADPPAGVGWSEGQFELEPQGTVATVYAKQFAPGEDAANPTAAHKTAVASLKTAIEQVDDTTASCQSDPDGPATNCMIQEVLYMRPELAPPGAKGETVKAKHPDWHLDNTFFDIDRETFEEIFIPTGASGDLLVVMKPGWKAGKPAPTVAELAAQGDNTITNPYLASGGGPRNRSIAAIVNGPGGTNSVRDLDTFDSRANGGRYPVAKTAEGTPDNPKCEPTKTKAEAATTDVFAANSGPLYEAGDDANATGHECQAEIADIGLTIAGLMRLPVRFQQIGGRLLYEAFDAGVLPPTIGERPALRPPGAFLTAGPLVAAPEDKYPRTYLGVPEQPDGGRPTFGFVAQPDKGTVVFECQLLSGEVPLASLPQTGWFACGEPPKVRPDLCQNTVDKDNDGEPDLKPDGTFKLAPFPCHSYQVNPELDLGLYTFSVRASNEAGTLGVSPASTIVFEVATVKPSPGYQCDRVVCGKLKAYVSDEEGTPARRAEKGTRLNSITVKGGFGERFTAVKLTFYEERVPKRGKSARAERLTALASFEPFVLRLKRDAKAKLTLAIPRRYKPSHLGIHLEKLKKRPITQRQLRVCQARSDTPSLCAYSRVGNCERKRSRTCDGDLLRIKDAKMLHTLAKAKKGRGGGKGGGGGKHGKRHSGPAVTVRKHFSLERAP